MPYHLREMPENIGKFRMNKIQVQVGEMNNQAEKGQQAGNQEVTGKKSESGLDKKWESLRPFIDRHCRVFQFGLNCSNKIERKVKSRLMLINCKLKQ